MSTTEYQRQWQRERSRSNKARRDAIKLATGCILCGYKDNTMKLHFHHRPGEIKSFVVSQRPFAPWDEIAVEIAKCDVLCVWCHDAQHGHMRSPSFPRWRGGRPGSARDPLTGRLVAS